MKKFATKFLLAILIAAGTITAQAANITTFTVSKETACPGDTVFLSWTADDSIGNYPFLAIIRANDGFVIDKRAMEPSMQNLGWIMRSEDGSTTFRLIQGNDSVTYTVTINCSTGISETENSQEFKIFPNPATDIVTISAPAQIVTITGQLIRSFESAGTFFVGDLPTATYVFVSNGNHKVFIKQ